MKAIVNTRAGTSSTLEVQEWPELSADNDQIRINVKACGLNFADILAREGLYQDAPPFPMVMGYEVSGVIDRVGINVDASLIGKEVIALTRFSGQAEQVLVKPDQIVFKPEKLSFEQAAAIPVNYLTAWMLLVEMGSLKATDTILIHNAGGGVGIAALDIARHIGARTLGTASSGKHDFLLKRGLDVAIDYRNSDWVSGVMKATDQKGVELIIDPLGGKNWKKSYRVLRASGRLGMFGVSEVTDSGLFGKLRLLSLLKNMPIFNPISLMNENKAVFGVNMGRLWHEPEKVSAWLSKLVEGVESGWLVPHVDRIFTFKEVKQAHDFLENRQNIGKVILVP